ncbi:MAG: TfoX/Sxy family protein [Sulfuritalea sp.]|nr:TfoX/Sxy family protein [Sulfuritalea sp.]
MAFDAGLAERLRDVLRSRQGVGERKMFGGLAFMLNGHMCVGIIGDTLMARVGPIRYAEALRQPHVREMDFTGKPMKGYVYVAPEGIEEDHALEAWVNISAEFIETLPPK